MFKSVDFVPSINQKTNLLRGLVRPCSASIFVKLEIAARRSSKLCHQVPVLSCMPHISTFLTFKSEAEEAARFYTTIFPNSSISRISRYPNLGPQSPFKAGSVMTVEFTLDGRHFTALNGGPQFSFSQGMSIAVLCDSQQQVDEYWNQFIAAGGKPLACGWLTDHFGVSWQVDPQLLIDMITNPDEAIASKAMMAMMGMVKIDSEQLKSAVRK